MSLKNTTIGQVGTTSLDRADYILFINHYMGGAYSQPLGLKTTVILEGLSSLEDIVCLTIQELCFGNLFEGLRFALVVEFGLAFAMSLINSIDIGWKTKETIMKTLRMTLLSISVLAFFLIPLDALARRPVVRARTVVSSHTPGVQISVRNSGRCGNAVQPVRGHSHQRRYRLTEKDQWLAIQMSRRSGVPRRWLLDDRLDRNSWYKIGRMWGMSRRSVGRLLAESRRVNFDPQIVRCLTRR